MAFDLENTKIPWSEADYSDLDNANIEPCLLVGVYIKGGMLEKFDWDNNQKKTLQLLLRNFFRNLAESLSVS